MGNNFAVVAISLLIAMILILGYLFLKANGIVIFGF